MKEGKSPLCCKKPMELKAVEVIPYQTISMVSYLWFQCKKCGRYENLKI